MRLRKKTRPRHNQHRYGPKDKTDRYEPNHREILWKEDPFYDWLPDHGHDRRDEHKLHRPLENARMHRLPSFSEDRFLGLQGHGIGVLRIWIKYAKNLRYDTDTNLRGRPSTCVEISCREEGSSGRNEMDPNFKAKTKLTPTIEHEANPVWNTGAFQFEVQSERDMIKLEVRDLLGQDNQNDIFLGRVERSVSSLLQKISPQYKFEGSKGTIKSLTFEEVLEGTSRGKGREQEQGVLGFQISFQKYTGTKLALTSSPSSQTQQHRPPSTTGSHYSAAQQHPQGQQGDYIGKIEVKQIKAKGLHGSGIMESFTHYGGSYVKAKLDTQTPQRALRTDSQAGADPSWSNLDWVFRVEQNDMYLEIAVHSEGIMGDDTTIGRLIIPVHDLLSTHYSGPLEDLLKDTNQKPTHGKLEVELVTKGGPRGNVY